MKSSKRDVRSSKALAR
jgi:signal-transduction protein with cAMP-binding, CBS, and nucleotidyltransferase domain